MVGVIGQIHNTTITSPPVKEHQEPITQDDVCNPQPNLDFWGKDTSVAAATNSNPPLTSNE
jgi:hypothetical protein